MSISTAESSAAYPTDVPTEPIWRFSVDQYHEMIRVGILTSGSPIELLEGWLVKKTVKNPRHRVATRKIRLALETAVGVDWSIDAQEPVTTSDSEPEPDVTVVKGDSARFVDRHPLPDEIGLLVEVADTSLQRDRGWKKRIYAAAGISIYWIVNLIDNCVEVFTGPPGAGDPSDYSSHEIFRPGESVPVVLDGKEVGRIAVDDLLP